VIFIGFLDLNWGCNIETKRPIIGFTFLLVNGVVSWMKKRKLMVACASLEAKYMVVLFVTKLKIYLKRLLNKLAFSP
jgi:hypothetical protein